LQRKIKAYLCLKKAINNYYNNSNCPYINKVNINKMFYITKEKSNENECLEKVKKIQKLYKKRYLYMKNNIINDVNSNDDKLILSKNGSFNIFPNYNGAVRSSKKKSNNNNDFTISSNNISYPNQKRKTYFIQNPFDKDNLNISEINIYGIKDNKFLKQKKKIVMNN
jgi:phosphoribosylformylglycinamidine (FGAM) synthase PurS component